MPRPTRASGQARGKRIIRSGRSLLELAPQLIGTSNTIVYCHNFAPRRDDNRCRDGQHAIVAREFWICQGVVVLEVHAVPEILLQ